MWTHVINFGLGVLLRLFNEHQKASDKNHALMMAAATKRNEFINQAKESTVGSTFLQSLMMVMIISALMVVAGFSLIASMLDVPLVVETIKTSGFWIFETEVTEFKEVTGLFLPEEFRSIIIAATEFIFGAIIGGIGRR